MRLIGVIPSRFASTRFPGKPLAIIMGKPMIWWVYNNVKLVKNLDEILVATDDERIFNVCRNFNMNVIMTKNSHQNCFYRMQEVAERIPADRYIMINGDEPLIEPACIQTIVDEVMKTNREFIFSYRKLTEPVETNDPGNIKVVISKDRLIYLSRIAIPFPHKSVLYNYNKIIGIQAFSKDMLDLFVNTPPGEIEKIEDIAELRWIEAGCEVYAKEVISNSVSVDNPKDIEKVESIIKQRIKDDNAYKFYEEALLCK